MNYIGEQCFYCGRTFEKGDDVVVCPECGTPYHRECYKTAGECINHQLHESGESWKRVIIEEKESEKPEAAKICPKCLHKNDGSADRCSECGFPLSDNGSGEQQPDMSSMLGGIDVTKQYMGFDPEEDFGGGARLKEVYQFVDTNTLYYIPLFKRMKEFGSNISFNFSCLLFPYFYFANRKMWLWAIITALISTLLCVPSLIYVIGDQMAMLPITQSISAFISSNKNILLTLSEICNIADWALRILTCLFGNYLYMRHTVRSINKVKAHYGGPVSPQRLKSMGGIQPANILIMLLIIMGMAAASYFLLVFVLMLFV